MQHYNMWLNPENCAFRVDSRKFLGFVLTHQGIKVNPKEANIVEEMFVLRNVNKV